MVDGTVKFYNIKKRFGFIKGDDEKDYFVHLSGIEKGNKINEGDRVTFTVEETEKGPNARNVKLLSSTE